MKNFPLWLKIISIPFALITLFLALSGYPILPIRDVGASGVILSSDGKALSEILFYVT